MKKSRIKEIIKEEIKILKEQFGGPTTNITQCLSSCSWDRSTSLSTINYEYSQCQGNQYFWCDQVANPGCCQNIASDAQQQVFDEYQSCVAECHDQYDVPHTPPTSTSGGGPTGGGSCFIAGTKVKMADGTDKNIEEVVIGDEVQGETGVNVVAELDWVQLANRKLYSFNEDGNYFTTSDHPFKTTEGWKSINPIHTKERDGVELFEQLTGELSVGNTLLILNGEKELNSIDSKEIDNPELQLYNFNLDGDHSYYANEYLVHNKENIDPNAPLDPEGDPKVGPSPTIPGRNPKRAQPTRRLREKVVKQPRPWANRSGLRKK